MRRDLGADVVCLPERDMIVIHPDLSYGNAVGELLAVMPGLTFAQANEYVSMVSRTPKAIERMIRRRVAQAAMMVSALFVLVGAPTVASAAQNVTESGVVPTSCVALDQSNHS